MGNRRTEMVRACVDAGTAVLTAVALLAVPGEPTGMLAAGPDGVTGGMENRSSLHLAGAFRDGRSGPSTSQIIPDRKAFPLSRSTIRVTLDEGPRLVAAMYTISV